MFLYRRAYSYRVNISCKRNIMLIKTNVTEYESECYLSQANEHK